MSGHAVPSYYRTCSFPKRNGVFYVGDAPSVTLSGAGAIAYEVRDYFGAVVSSGALSALATTCTPQAPAGGWRPGWYRIYFTGPTNDTVVGYAVAATAFTVIRDDPRFPPMPPTSYPTEGYAEYSDPAAKAILGLGHSRVIVNNYATIEQSQPGTGFLLEKLPQHIAKAKAYWTDPGVPYADTVRPARRQWCATPGACADSLSVAGANSGTYLRIYAATEALAPQDIYVATGPGTSAGTKVQVYYPNVSTLAETWDNLGDSNAAATVINQKSSLVRVFAGGQSTAATTAATVIGNETWAGIVTAVTAFWPDVKVYEFTNEPSMNAETAHQMRLFRGAVKAGNASAVAIGPCPVEINNIGAWESFLAAGGGQWCDEISFHDYNSVPTGDLGAGRDSIEAFLALLDRYGMQGKTLWQTEAGAAFTAVYGVHHPRRARVKMMHTLLWEQYGLPRERNPHWYDISHGFWDFPMFWQMADRSLSPDAALHRTLAEETFGMNLLDRLDFGELSNRVALGSLYAGPGGRCVAIQTTSAMSGATVTIATSAAGPLTVVDAFGNTSAVTVSGGLVTVPVAEVPTYLRLPAGAAATAYRVNDWPIAAQLNAWPNTAVRAVARSGSNPDGTATRANNGRWRFGETYHGLGVDGGGYDGGLPDWLSLEWETASRFDRVIVWSGRAFSGECALVDFDVQTSNDGSTWTTRATVTRPAPSSFKFGTSSSNVWCTRETFWDEQWVYDVKLPAPVTARFLRLYVRDTSLGGEPDVAALLAGGQGWHKRVSVQEIAVLCDDNTKPQYVVNLS